MNRRKRMLNDLGQDIRDHIEVETQENITRGMSPEEARYAALRKFGNVTRVKEETRRVDGSCRPGHRATQADRLRRTRPTNGETIGVSYI
jgi:hypothetical protein